MSVDDKLVLMFDMMTGFTSLNKRVQNIEHNIESMLLQNDETNRRMKYLEYKSIDLESRSRRNNLVFRGLQEALNYENCEEIVTNFICEHLDMNGDNMHIVLIALPRIAYVNVELKTHSKENENVIAP